MYNVAIPEFGVSQGLVRCIRLMPRLLQSSGYKKLPRVAQSTHGMWL
jgi:hypothetical protein